MKRALLSPRAQADLNDIWDYTAQRWSIDQAEHYLHRIQAAIQMLAADPRIGLDCGDIRPGVWKFASGSHVVFYRPNRDRIDIIRILHARMDFPRHM